MQSTSYSRSAHTQNPQFNQSGQNYSTMELLDSSSCYELLSPRNDVVGDFQHPHNVPPRPNFTNTGRGLRPEAPKQNCGFLTRAVDNCSKSRIYALALEYYLLEEPVLPAHQGVRCLMSECPGIFNNAKQMLWHLRECTFFSQGKYDCPECNTTETFRTVSKKKCSWFRTRFSSRATQIIHASADFMKRLIGPTSDLCTNCKHNVKRNFGRTLRSYGTSMEAFEDFPGPSASRERLHSCSGKRPSTNSSSLSSGRCAPDPYELSDESHIHELPSRESRVELGGNSTFTRRRISKHLEANCGFNMPQPPDTNSSMTSSDVSCISPRSMGDFTPDVSPTSSGKSPVDNTTSTPYHGLNAYLQVNNLDSSANVDQLSADLASNLYGPSTQFTPGNDVSDLSTTMFSQGICQGGNAPSSFGEESGYSKQLTRSPNMDIPPRTAQYQGAAVTWPVLNIPGFTFNPLLDSCDTPIAANALSAPAEHDFDNELFLPRSHMTPFSRPPPAVSGITIGLNESQFYRQRNYSTFSSSEDVPPNSAISNSTCSVGEADLASPAGDDGSKQHILSPSELRCSECGFTPKGKTGKLATYFQKHQAIHRGQRFSCLKCDKSYSRKDNAAAHARKIHGEGSSILGIPSPATGGGNNRKRQGSGGGTLSPQQQRKKSRSYSNESAAASAASAALPVAGSEWGAAW